MALVIEGYIGALERTARGCALLPLVGWYSTMMAEAGCVGREGGHALARGAQGDGCGRGRVFGACRQWHYTTPAPRVLPGRRARVHKCAPVGEGDTLLFMDLCRY